jgi:hypothetical protein
MSRYEVALVRGALCYLVATALLGFAFFWSPALAAYFRTTHVHLGLVGFFLSFVMGVAYWLMPRPGGLRQERAEAVTFYLLNAGLLSRAALEPLWRLHGLEGLRAALAVSAALQVAAVLVFAAAMWRRARTKEDILARRSGSRQE